MICHEVIELMQRHLDRDLQDDEYMNMLAHLDQCGECSDLFQRLKRLHQGLEQLPKVTPAFSLVDAILPQLEQLDLASSPAAGITVVKGLKGSDGTAGTEMAGAAERHKKAASGYRPWGWIGAVAAACLAVIFVWQTGSPKTEKFADHASMGMDKRADSVSDAKTMSTAEKALPAADSGTQSGTEQHTDSSAGVYSAKDSIAQAPQVSSPSLTGSNESAGTTSHFGTDSKGSVSKVGSAKGIAADSSASGASADKSKEGTTSSKADGGPVSGIMGGTTDNPPMGLAAPNAQKSAPSDEQGQLMSPVQALPAPTEAAKQAAPGPLTGITFDASIIAAQEAPSPNGTYEAAIQNNGRSRFVAVTSKNGLKLFVSANRWSASDTIVLGAWDSETVFHYTVKSGGTAKEYQVDVVGGKEKLL